MNLVYVSIYISELETGFSLSIKSDFGPLLGLGSSAAILALAHANMYWLIHHKKINQTELFKRCYRSLQRIKGVGSGADIATSIFGGCILFNGQTKQVKQLKFIPNVQIIYTGNKTPTDEVIEFIEKRYADQQTLLADIDIKIDQLATNASCLIEQQQWQSLGALMGEQQRLMNAMGLSTPEINAALDILTVNQNSLGAKISGSGLGDCVIGLLEPKKCLEITLPSPLESLNTKLGTVGLAYENQ